MEGLDRVIGVSIIPFMRDPKFNSLLFVLGRERPDLNFPDSGTWGDFSGRVQPSETPIQAACREVWEETMGMMKFSHSDPIPVPGWSALEQRLKEGGFALRLIFKNRRGRPQYITYVIEVPFDPYLPRRFDSVRKSMMRTSRRQAFEIHPLFRHIHGKHDCFLEKSELRLFGYPLLRNALERADGLLVNRFDARQFLRPTSLSRFRVLVFELTQGRVDLTERFDPYVLGGRSTYQSESDRPPSSVVRPIPEPPCHHGFPRRHSPHPRPPL